MNPLQKVLYLGGALAFSATLSGCLDDGVEPIFNPDEHSAIGSSGSLNSSSSGTSSSSLSVYDSELMYNYDILDYFYLYAHTQKELGDYEDYTGPTNYSVNTKSYCYNSNYARVCSMYDDMSDPFTRYYDPYYAATVLSYLNTSESTVGIGATVSEVQVDDTTTAVVFSQVYAGGPCDNSGILEGDTVLTVNDSAVTTVEEFEKATEGSKGDKLSIEVKRGESTVTLKVTISEFNAPTVYLTYEDSIPVIQITEFTSETVSSDGTYGEFVDALNKIKDDYKSAIIDLRGNPGGDVDQCSDIAAELLSAGDTIIIDVETNVDSSGYGNNKTYFQVFDTTAYTAANNGIGKDLYYVFLADSNSASCAELMLSAVTVNKKSPVVGLITYGKGIGQYVFETYNYGLALVTGLKSMDKNGDVYHKVGIVPDYETADSTEQMSKAVEWAKEMKQTRRTTGYYGTENTGHFAKAMAMGESGFPTSKKQLLKQMNGAYKIRRLEK